MSDFAGNPGPDYMRRFAFVTIPVVFTVACLLFGFQDSLHSIGGGLVLAAPCIWLFAFMTFFNVTHTGGMAFYATIISIVLDVLLVIFIIIMLVHIKQDARLQQQATGLLFHLARSTIFGG